MLDGARVFSKVAKDCELDCEGMSGILHLLRGHGLWMVPPVVPGVFEDHARLQPGNDCTLAVMEDLLHGRLVVPSLDVERASVRYFVEGFFLDLLPGQH